MTTSELYEQPCIKNNRKWIPNNPLNFSREYDDLEDAFRYLDALVSPLIETDFIEIVDAGTMRSYMACVQEKIQQGTAALRKITGCFYREDD